MTGGNHGLLDGHQGGGDEPPLPEGAPVTIETPTNKIAHTIYEALATAYGGFSQVPEKQIGAAVFGWQRNGCIPAGITPAAVIESAAGIVEARWQNEEFPRIRRQIAAGYEAARRRANRASRAA